MTALRISYIIEKKTRLPESNRSQVAHALERLIRDRYSHVEGCDKHSGGKSPRSRLLPAAAQEGNLPERIESSL